MKLNENYRRRLQELAGLTTESQKAYMFPLIGKSFELENFVFVPTQVTGEVGEEDYHHGEGAFEMKVSGDLFMDGKRVSGMDAQRHLSTKNGFYFDDVSGSWYTLDDGDFERIVADEPDIDDTLVELAVMATSDEDIINLLGIKKQ